MTRTDTDTWSITDSVGATALQVAAARAAETESRAPLISDPYVRAFLDEAGPGVWSAYADPQLLGDADPDVLERVRAMIDFMAVRTLFFDEFFRDAVDAGIRQMVILASGLDARPYRLPWPEHTVIYEVDLPAVLKFKRAALACHSGATTTAEVVYVPADLRRDWPTRLRGAGFDPSAPAAFSAEGLLRYLTPHAQDDLLAAINALSVPGGRVAVNAVSAEAWNPRRLERQHDRMRRLEATIAEHLGVPVPDLDDLWYPQPRGDVAAWLRGHGWDVTATPLRELLARYARSEAADDHMPNLLISARRATTR